MQEATRQDAGCLGCKELPPRRGAEPGGSQDPPERPLPHPVPQAEQLALDAPVSAAGFSRASCSTRARTVPGTCGRPGAFG